MSDTPPFIRHIEDHLGIIDPHARVWRFQKDNARLQVVAFRGQPRPGATTLCSLGLGWHDLCSPAGHVRQELLLACLDRFLSERLAALLAWVALDVAARHIALRPGQVYAPAGALLAGSELVAFVCLEPRIYPPTLVLCRETEPPTELLWLVPVSAGEFDEVVSGGLVPLLERWERSGTDLLDWHRRAGT